MKREDPLAGLSVPSIEEIVDSALSPFGIATLDLGDPAQRAKLHSALCSSLRRAVRWKLAQPMEQACSRAVQHVIELIGDREYQEKRARRRTAAAEVRRERNAERAKVNAVEKEERRQRSKGMVQ